MRLDAHNQFASALDVKGADTTATASTNYIDLAIARQVGRGQPVICRVGVTTAFTGASATVVVTAQTDDNTSFSSATTAQTIGTLAALSAAGSELIVPLAIEGINERYLRLMFTVTGAELTAGNVDADLVLDADSYTAFAAGVTSI